MKLTLSSTTKLNNGVAMPWLGLGVYQSSPGKVTERAVRAALDCGYRHIDTARIYGNEEDVGRALKESGVPRSEVFLTTKIWNSDQGYDSTLRACEQSLELLGIDVLDLYLIHWPEPHKRAETWKALVKLREEGRCRAIGVSNYTVRHLTELLEQSGVVPAVNQVELSPFLFQKELWEFCRERKIQLEAYSPLTQGKKLKHPVLVKTAEHHGKSPAQALIRWGLQHEIVVIPKSVHAERIQENAGVFDFELTPDEMKALDGLDEGFRTCWDPSRIP